MKPYPKYKDSGIEWLGEIPEGWEVIKTQYLLDVISGNGFPENLQGITNGEYPFFKVSDINIDSTFITEANNSVPKEMVFKNNWKIIPSNSILLPKIGEALKKNHRIINKKNCLIDNNMMALYPKKLRNINRHFLYFLLCYIDMEWFVNPGAVPSVDVKKFKLSYLPIPSEVEQNKISAFLDQKTTKIDELVKKNERLVEILKEKRQAIISHAVTKGLDPNAKMKDLEIEWLGKVPEGWEVIRIKSLISNNKNGYWGEEEQGDENDICCIRVADFDYDNFGLSLKNLTIRNLPKNIQKKVKLQPGDLLIEKSGGGEKQPIGRVVYFNEKIDAVCSNFIEKLQTTINTRPNYMKYVFSWLYTIGLNTRSIKQTTGIQNLDLYSYLCEKISIPGEKLQTAIANFLDQKTTRIDETIKKILSQIDTLKEYRQALISNVVTGKVRV